MEEGVFEVVTNAIEHANIQREADNPNWQDIFMDRCKDLPYPDRVLVFRELQELKKRRRKNDG